jgi:hypothetical protein
MFTRRPLESIDRRVELKALQATSLERWLANRQPAASGR